MYSMENSTNEIITNSVEFVSLGNWCITSHAIKLSKLKKSSYPFDWIFSSHQMIINFLEEATLFTYNNLVLESGKTHHKVYGDIFNHHDPLVSIEDYQYFERCVDRFIELKSKEHVCFVGITFQNTDHQSLYNTLCQHFTRFSLVSIDKQHGRKNVVCKVLANNWKMYSIFTENMWNGNNWDAHVDNEIKLVSDILLAQ